MEISNVEVGALGTAAPPVPVIKRRGYYSDLITKHTAPFWIATCKECGHAGWSVTRMVECSKCKSKNLTCVPANEHKK